jgi:hypothetical protein
LACLFPFYCAVSLAWGQKAYDRRRQEKIAAGAWGKHVGQWQEKISAGAQRKLALSSEHTLMLLGSKLRGGRLVQQ